MGVSPGNGFTGGGGTNGGLLAPDTFSEVNAIFKMQRLEVVAFIPYDYPVLLQWGSDPGNGAFQWNAPVYCPAGVPKGYNRQDLVSESGKHRYGAFRFANVNAGQVSSIAGLEYAGGF